jgi:hypothetical protein
MNKSGRFELWISSTLLLVCLLIPDLLLRQLWKEPTLRRFGLEPARTVSSGQLSPASSPERHKPRPASAAASLAAATVGKLHLLAQAARRLLESEQARLLVSMPRTEALPQAIAPPQPKTIRLEPLSYVKEADGRVEATIFLGERVQVVHEGETYEVNFKVAKISSTTVELVENPAPVASEPHLMAELRPAAAQAPVLKAQQAGPRPRPKVLSNPVTNGQSTAASVASVPEPSVGQELGYVERADGRVEAIIADGEDIRLAPATKSFANNFRPPQSTSANLEAANTLPPLINPLDSFGQESQSSQANSSTQEPAVPVEAASGPESSPVSKPEGIRENKGDLGSERFGIIQPEPLAEFADSRLEPLDIAPAPHTAPEGVIREGSTTPPLTDVAPLPLALPAGAADSSVPAGSGRPIRMGTTPLGPPEGKGSQSGVNVLGYVVKPGEEEEAIVEIRGEVYLMHKGELLTEKSTASQGSASSVAAQAMNMPPTPPVLKEIFGMGAGGAIQGIFAVQVGAFRDRINAERLKERIEPHFRPVIIQDFKAGDGLFYRVRVGNADTENAARELADRLRRAKLTKETFPVRLK